MYYWVLVQTTSLTSHSPHYSNHVITEHPFEWISKKAKTYPQDIQLILLNWKQITVEEYIKW